MSGIITKVSGPLVVAEGLADANVSDVVRVGSQRLIGEILNMTGDSASIQVYEETSGLGPGAEVVTTGLPLSVELGPGMLENIYDGIQRPLPEIRALTGETITRGYYKGVSTSGGNTVDWDDIKKTTPDSGSAVTDFGDGIINNGKGALTYDKDTTVIIVDGTKHIEGGDIDEIVYVKGDTDASSKVVLVEGTGSDEGHADYVFIIR